MKGRRFSLYFLMSLSEFVVAEGHLGHKTYDSIVFI